MLKQIGRGKRFPLFTLLIYESIKTVTFMGTGTDWMNEHSKLRWIIGKKHLIEITTKWNSHNSLLLSKSKTIPRIEHNSTNPNYTSQNLKQFPESKNSSRTPKTLPRIWNIRGFWKYLTWLFPISRANIIHILHYIYFTISTQPHLPTKLFPVMLHIQILDVAYGISFLCSRFCCFEAILRFYKAM